MVIDDDPSAFTLVQHMLLTMDKLLVTVEWVDSYEKGLATLEQKRHDIYLIDYRMGGDNSGFHLLRKAAELKVDAPIIILTAYGTYDLDVEAMRLGAMDYLDKKRLTPELLERSIRYALERQHNECELRQLNERVSALEQLKTDMIRLAAHDIKNPLATILLTVQLMRKFHASGDSDKLATLIDNIDIAASKIRLIISSILSLERIEELHKDSLYSVDLGEVVAAAYQEYEAAAHEKSHIFTLRLPDEPTYVYSTTDLIFQIVANLIDNAIKYTPHGGHITVRVEKQTTEAVFEVEDDGCGVALAVQDKVFQPFFRVSVSDDEVAGGTGLGLHLVKSVVMRHKGSIIFRSIEGQGSTFGFRFPLVSSTKQNL